MTDRLEFFAQFEPPTTTDQQHRFVYSQKANRVIAFKGKKVIEARKALKDAMRPFVPDEPFVNPVRVIAIWAFPYRKTEKKAVVKDNLPVGKYTRPDGMNLQKALDDVMTELSFWTDDALIVDERVYKVWWSVPGIYIRIEEADSITDDVGRLLKLGGTRNA